MPSPEHDAKKEEPTVAWDLIPHRSNLGQGWAKGPSPLASHEVPRARDGEPMKHLLTVLIPREYRTAGDTLVALSLFQDPEGEDAPDNKVKKAHPREHRMTDELEGEFALVWLTKPEFARGPQGKGRKPSWIRLQARFEDPNTGKRVNGRGYLSPFKGAGRGLPERFHRNHFGGTSSTITAKAPARYLELEEFFCGANFGGTSARVALQKPSISWGED